MSLSSEKHLLPGNATPIILYYVSFVISQQMGCYLLKLSLMSPPVSPYPFFHCFCPLSLLSVVRKFLLNLGMKWWNSAFNAQGSRVIIVVVQVWAVKIYVAAVQALKKKETPDETQFITKIGGKTSLGLSYFLL